jgi:tetratricopeptide (TPR) repeat protein
LAVLALVLTAAITAGYYSYPYFRVRGPLHRGQQHLDSLELPEAQAQFEECLRLCPGHGEASVLLARTFRLKEQYVAAARQLKEAEQIRGSGSALEFEKLLLKAQETGDLNDATASLSEVMQSSSTDAALVLQALALGAFRQKRLDRASALLHSWAERFPDDWRGCYMLGIFFLTVGNLEAARAQLQSALACNPHQADVRRWLGITLIRLGHDIPQALEHLEYYQRAHPDVPEVLLALANAKYALGQSDAATFLVQRLLQNHPNNIGGLLFHAQLEADAGRWQQALDEVGRVETLDAADLRETSAMLVLKARLLRLLDRTSEAAAAEQQFKQFSQDLDELRMALNSSSRREPNAASQRTIGILYLRLGNLAEAMAWFARIPQADPIMNQALADYYGRRTDPQSQQLAESYRRKAKESAP